MISNVIEVMLPQIFSQSPEVLWKGWTKNLPQATAMADNDMVDEAEAPVAAPSSSSSSSLDERPAAPETADNDMADEAPVAPETADNDMADEAPVAPETADNDMADEADTAERAREVQSPVETIAYPDSDDDHVAPSSTSSGQEGEHKKLPDAFATALQSARAFFIEAIGCVSAEGHIAHNCGVHRLSRTPPFGYATYRDQERARMHSNRMPLALNLKVWKYISFVVEGHRDIAVDCHDHRITPKGAQERRANIARRLHQRCAQALGDRMVADELQPIDRETVAPSSSSSSSLDERQQAAPSSSSSSSLDERPAAPETADNDMATRHQ
eukprot:g4370.t1